MVPPRALRRRIDATADIEAVRAHAEALCAQMDLDAMAADQEARDRRDAAARRTPGEIPELLVVLRAIARGTSRTRFRVHEVVCPYQHRLAEVFQTGVGLVIYGMASHREPGHRRVRAVGVAARLDDSDFSLAVTCRCGSDFRVSSTSLHQQIEAGGRRSVAHGRSGTLGQA